VLVGGSLQEGLLLTTPRAKESVIKAPPWLHPHYPPRLFPLSNTTIRTAAVAAAAGATETVVILVVTVVVYGKVSTIFTQNDALPPDPTLLQI